MRAPSADTLSLIDELYRLVNERTWPLGAGARDNEIASVLQRIVDRREPLAIPRIISVVLDSRRAIAEAAGQAVKALRDLVNAREHNVFDRAFRDMSPWSPWSARWREMAPAELRTVAVLAAGPTLLQLAMCHPSGYVREEAIRRSAACADGSEVAYLLLRANDWVKPVRDVAHAALRARLSAEHVPDLVAALPIVDAMHRWKRLGSTEIIDEIERLLTTPSAVPGLLAALSSKDRFIRRGVYRRLLEHQRLDAPPASTTIASGGPYRVPATTAVSKEGIIEAAMRDPDPAIRTWASRWLLVADEASFAPLAPRLLRNRLGAVRFGTAQRLHAAGLPLPWAELLLDPHAGVRALAQQVALEQGKDPDAEYRERVAASEGSVLGTVLVGLSETGGPADVAIVRPQLSSGRPVVRRCALYALASFKVDDIVDVALASLGDRSPSVTRAARDLLIARISRVRGPDVWNAFVAASTDAGKRAALAVISHLGYWESLPHLLRAFEISDESLRPRVLLYLARWLARQARAFVSPPLELANEVRQLLRHSKLPAHTRREVVGVLDARVHT